jgi:glycosyltransferase involved in cell wall biosynthesis
VSVVIPCYNQAHFLGEAIESVLAQSHPHFEIVVVDGGSSDNTSEVAARYPRVRCVRQENQGLSGARNTGLRESKGSYVEFLDADDRLLPEALAADLECFEAHPECAFVYGDYNRIAGDGSFLDQPRRGVVYKDRYLALLQGNHISMHATVMYRRSVFESVGDFDTSLGTCEDYDMYLRIARKFSVHHHENVVAEYRKHGTNATRNSALMLAGTVTVLRRQRRHVRENRRYRDAYKDGMKYFCHILYSEPLVEEVRTYLRKRDWKRALRNALVLLWYYPQGLALLLLNEQRMEQYVERRELARRLNRRKQTLKIRAQLLKELKDTQKPEDDQELGRTLAAERKEIRRLRKSTRGLERRMRKRAQQGDKRLFRSCPGPYGKTEVIRRGATCSREYAISLYEFTK